MVMIGQEKGALCRKCPSHACCQAYIAVLLTYIGCDLQGFIQGWLSIGGVPAQLPPLLSSPRPVWHGCPRGWGGGLHLEDLQCCKFFLAVSRQSPPEVPMLGALVAGGVRDFSTKR